MHLALAVEEGVVAVALVLGRHLLGFLQDGGVRCP